ILKHEIPNVKIDVSSTGVGSLQPLLPAISRAGTANNMAIDRTAVVLIYLTHSTLRSGPTPPVHVRMTAMTPIWGATILGLEADVFGAGVGAITLELQNPISRKTAKGRASLVGAGGGLKVGPGGVKPSGHGDKSTPKDKPVATISFKTDRPTGFFDFDGA